MSNRSYRRDQSYRHDYDESTRNDYDESTDWELNLDETQEDEPFLNITEHESFAFVEREETTSKWIRFIEYLALVIFTFMQIFKPILVRVAHKESEHNAQFLGSTVVFATEILKIIFCCVIIPIKYRSLKKLFTLIYDSFTVNKIETLKICMPALIYVIQNNLYFFALQRIDATLFVMTYQLQILTTALLMILILNRRFSYLQWLALAMSMIGVIVVRVGNHATHIVNPNTVHSNVSDQVVGLVAVFIMCWTNAFGGVYLEAVMKKSGDDIFLQNIRLSLISLPMSAATIISDYRGIAQHGFFSGWNYYVWLIVLTSAFAGIVVSAVIRYADNIKKSFCQAIALGGTAFVSVSLGDSMFSYYLLAGVSLVVISVVLYSFSSQKKKTQTANQTGA